MTLESVEPRWLSEERQLSLAELADLAGMPEAELRELVDYGAIAPADPGSARWVFQATCLVTARTAYRLRASFELEPHGVALVLSLLDRIKDLEGQLASVRARLPGEG